MSDPGEEELRHGVSCGGGIPALGEPALRLQRRDFLKAGLGSVGIALAAGCSSPAAAPRRPEQSLGSTLKTLAGIDPPAVTVTQPARGVAPGYVLLSPNLGPGYQQGVMLLDSAGALVWFEPLQQRCENLQLQQYRGRPCLTWWEGEVVLPGYGEGSYVIVDDTYRVVRRVTAINGLKGDLHEFVLTPAGTALFTAFEARHSDLSSVGGPKDGTLLDSLFQEIDLETGKLLMQWRASDHVALNESYTRPDPRSKRKWDFFHINSIDVDTDGHLLISARHTWAVYKINRTTGQVIWRLNGKRSDFSLGHRAGFSWQHHARHHPGGTLSLFDDGAGLYKTESRSRGIVLSLDTRRRTATLLREYLPRPNMLATSQGSVQLLDNGHVFVGWGSEPYFSEYDADGTIVFNARLPLRCHSYRAFKAEWVGRPQTSPAVAADRASNGDVVLHVSWNGATAVSAWRVHGGPAASRLSFLATFRRTGFETEMRVRTRAEFLQVLALDGSGREIGRSEVVHRP